MDDKDRLGDKLREKGKAAEDLFIAEQERKYLERLRKSGADTGHGTCPKDGTKLLVREEHGVTIDACPTCKGIWLEQGELETILRNDEAGVTTWVRSLLGR
jgi:hypothetical protein